MRSLKSVGSYRPSSSQISVSARPQISSRRCQSAFYADLGIMPTSSRECRPPTTTSRNDVGIIAPT